MDDKKAIQNIAETLVEEMGFQLIDYKQLESTNPSSHSNYNEIINAAYLKLPEHRLIIGFWPYKLDGGFLMATVETSDFEPDAPNPDEIGLGDYKFYDKVGAQSETIDPVLDPGLNQIGYSYRVGFEISEFNAKNIMTILERIIDVASESGILPGKISEMFVYHGRLTPYKCKEGHTIEAQREFIKDLLGYDLI